MVKVSEEYLKELQYMHKLVCSLHDAWLGNPFGEVDEKLIEIRLKRLMDWFRVEDEDEEGVCSSCNGSGEGMYDGSTCHECGGRGE